MLAEAGAHGARGAVAVVGQRLDDHRDAAGAVALVADLVVVLGVAALAALDRPLDVVLGHVGGLGRLDRGAQARVERRVGQPALGRHLDLALQPREQLARWTASWRPLRCMMFLNCE